MRLIDADEIFYDQLLNTGCKEHPLEFAVSKKRIDDMPTIEPQQEIVRCKDCKYNPNEPRLYSDDDPVETFIHCQFMQEDDFCSKGKRREP